MAVTLADALPWRIGAAVDRCLGSNPIDNTVFLERSDAGKELAVVLGWGGALQKHLSRLRQFYLSEGYSVISYISPMCCFLERGPISEDINEIATSICRLLPEGTGRFHVHIHSNNGTMVWGALMLALRESYPDSLTALRGIVMDSAPRIDPSLPKLWMHALGFTFPCIPIMLRRNRYIHPIWTPVLFLYFLYRLIYLRFRPPANRRFTWLQLREVVLHGMPIAVPQLYIYSTKDQLISSAAVESFMSRQSERGIQTSSKRFSDTPHVQHLLRKELEYKETLLNFLQRVS